MYIYDVCIHNMCLHIYIYIELIVFIIIGIYYYRYIDMIYSITYPIV